MKIIPVFHVSDMRKSLDFYTSILGFKLKSPDEEKDIVINITNDYADIQLSSIDGTTRAVVNVRVGDVDSLFETLIKRGLDTSKKKESPVHQGPLDQTCGMREFMSLIMMATLYGLESLYSIFRLDGLYSKPRQKHGKAHLTTLKYKNR